MHAITKLQDGLESIDTAYFVFGFIRKMVHLFFQNSHWILRVNPHALLQFHIVAFYLIFMRYVITAYNLH